MNPSMPPPAPRSHDPKGAGVVGKRYEYSREIGYNRAFIQGNFRRRNRHMLSTEIGDNVIKERLSIAYIHAVASRAGCEATGWGTDYDCIDGTIKPLRSARNGRRLPSIGIQAKATSKLKKLADDKHYSFPLSRESYDLLRAKSFDPILLVVFDMPTDPDEWLKVTKDVTTLKRCAYWKDMRGEPAITTDSAAVRIPTANIFDPDAIVAILERADAENRKGA